MAIGFSVHVSGVASDVDEWYSLSNKVHARLGEHLRIPSPKLLVSRNGSLPVKNKISRHEDFV